MKLFGKGIKIGIIDSGVDYTVSWKPSFRIELLEKKIYHIISAYPLTQFLNSNFLASCAWRLLWPRLQGRLWS